MTPIWQSWNKGVRQFIVKFGTKQHFEVADTGPDATGPISNSIKVLYRWYCTEDFLSSESLDSEISWLHLTTLRRALRSFWPETALVVKMSSTESLWELKCFFGSSLKVSVLLCLPHSSVWGQDDAPWDFCSPGSWPSQRLICCCKGGRANCFPLNLKGVFTKRES